MIDCIIGSWDAILKISAHGRLDEGVVSAITPLEIYIDKHLSNVDIVLFCIADIGTLVLMIFYFRF